MTAVNNENINTSPRATARSRQQSTNSLFAKASASPSKRALYTFDGPSKASAKSGSPRGDAAGAPEWHLRSTASRSSPLAPLGANTQAAHRQSAQDKVNLSTPSPLSVLPGPASKADGLRLHWDEVVPSIASQGATTPSQSSSTRSSYEQDSQSRHQLAFLSAQDLSIPDLQDADIVGHAIANYPP